MPKYTAKKRRKYNNKSFRKQNKKTKRNKIVKMGGHRNQKLQHYHLYIKFPNGSTKEMPEVFLKTETGEDGSETSARVRDIQNFVMDRGIEEPFTLFWKNRKLTDPDVKIRQIVVDGEKIPLYNGSFASPIFVKLNKNIHNLDDFLEHDLDTDDINTPR